MTREKRTKLIRHLRYNRSIGADYLITDEDADEIIKALEQEPCDDAISRQAAIDALCKALYEYEDVTEKQFIESEELDVGDWFQHRIFVQNMSDIDRQTILALPSAQPERKAGRWIDGVVENSIKGISLPIQTCSECKTFYPLAFTGGGTHFCPNCGAKMEVEMEVEK